MAGFNPWNEVNRFMKEVREFIAEQRQFNQEQRQFNQEQRQFNQEQRQFNQGVLERLEAIESKVDYLVSELSRFKNDSDNLLISVFAFCTLHGINFSQRGLAQMGREAARYSRKHGYTLETTQDPRFGEVYLYEPEALENLFLRGEIK